MSRGTSGPSGGAGRGPSGSAGRSPGGRTVGGGGGGTNAPTGCLSKLLGCGALLAALSVATLHPHAEAPHVAPVESPRPLQTARQPSP